ncbi:MAG TPA: PKD domain-containing protein, partial [Flavobacteriales bacterium]|nr:PKD domain-containing protein [Flavobacteriales bacterium]
MAQRNELDAFDQHLRGSLDQFEVPYNSADWSQLERALDGERRGWWFSGAGLATLLIAGAVTVGGATYLWSNGQDRVAEAAGTTPATNEQPAANAGTEQASPAPNASTATVNTAASTSGNTGNDPHASNGNGMYSAQLGTGTAHTPASGNTNTPKGDVNTQPAATVEPVAKADGATPVTTKGTSSTEAAKSEPTFHASISEGCPGSPVNFKVEHMPEDGIYLWNFGDGSFSNKPNPEHTFTKPGSYQVMLSMSSEGVGTIHNKPSSDVIVIHEAPHASFNVLKQEYDG